MNDQRDPRMIKNQVPRPQTSVADAMRNSGIGNDFDEKNMPGRIDEAAMLSLMAQNTELKNSVRAPSHIQDAVRGAQAPNDYPPQRESQARNPNMMRGQEQMPAGIPQHILDKMSNISRMQADPNYVPPNVDPSQAPNPNMNRNSGPNSRHVPDPNEEWEREDLVGGFDRNLDSEPDENGRVGRSPRLPPRRQPPITNQPDGPRRQPQISDGERAAILRARGDDAPEQVFTPTKPRFVLRKIESKGGFVRFTPVSGGVFYKGADNIQVRKFNLVDAMNLEKAKQNNDITTQIDVLQESIGDTFDVRDMTMGDFVQLHYWHRFNSYQSIPLILNWTSKYGNKAQYRLTETEIQYKTMSIQEDELQAWLDEGYSVPRARDFEMFSREKLSPEEQYIANRAQFFVGNPRADGLPPDIQDKIDMMMEKTADSIDAIARINEFNQLTDHGVVERVMLKDSLFNREKHLENLRSRQEALLRNIDRLATDSDPEALRQLLALEMEFDEVEEEIEKWSDEGAAAEVEDVSLNIPLLNFFPTV